MWYLEKELGFYFLPGISQRHNVWSLYWHTVPYMQYIYIYIYTWSIFILGILCLVNHISANNRLDIEMCLFRRHQNNIDSCSLPRVAVLWPSAVRGVAALNWSFGLFFFFFLHLLLSSKLCGSEQELRARRHFAFTACFYRGPRQKKKKKMHGR